VKVMDGRPIKLEGNPEHPLSRGGLCATGQASLLSLYDPYRQKHPSLRGQRVTWSTVDQQVMEALAKARQQNRKVVLLTGTINGRATLSVIGDFLARFPKGEHVVYEAIAYDALREAHRIAYGREFIPVYRLDKAEVIVSFSADFLGTWLSPVEFTKQYASSRVPAFLEGGTGKPQRMSRHFQFESRLSLTGSNADFRYPISPSEQAVCLKALLLCVARMIGRNHPLAAALAETVPPALPPESAQRVAKVATALVRCRRRSLVLTDSHDLDSQLCALALNEMLGNVGSTVDIARSSYQKMGHTADIIRLIEEMERGEVAVLLIYGCNPAYTYPEADRFLKALQKVTCSVSFACTPDETAAATRWHCPANHPMEDWGDAEPQSGRLSLYQPTIRPLYDTRGFGDSLLKWSGRQESFHQFLQHYWETNIFPRQKEFNDFPSFWDAVLQRGFIELPLPQAARASSLRVQPVVQVLQRPPESQPTGIEVELFEPVALRDGEAANNPWLQELPDPLSKITWDNYACLAPALARERQIAEGQLLEIGCGNRTIKVPAHIQPGQHPRTISIPLGYGRTQAGPIGNGVGCNAYPLVSMQNGRRRLTGLITAVTALSQTVVFARTQTHDLMEDRPIVQEVSLTNLQSHRKVTPHEPEEEANLWEEHEYPEYKWGMVIDLTRCTGCSACVTACDIENNVAMVGREEVRRQREMHWMRIDRYFQGDGEHTRVLYQPMLCQHCANASCETVCPVLATVHDDQGLNVQVYNRCVGTRYCANNCPYKVRRFNFFNNISNDLTRNLALNPEVTVRSRGVMEKCSFCLQRIQAARVTARREGRKVRDGEVQPACQQSCPADAIVFGNLADPGSRVSRLARSPRSFRVLEELNRQPSVYYLAKVRQEEEKG